MASRGANGRFIKAGEKRRLENLKGGERLGGKRIIREKGSVISNESCISRPSEIGRDLQWNEGRRVVELAVLAEGLEKCCASDCNEPLRLKNIECETKLGLSSLLYVRCVCGELNKVPTSKSHGEKQRGRSLYDVNTKLATGLIHAGLSIVSVQRLLECLEIPPPSRNCLKQREREVGPVFEKIADATCKNALELETFLSWSECQEGPVDITASYDMGWQKRSSGRAYNSKSGVGVLVGKESGKLLGYSSRISNCKQCEVNDAKNIRKAHDCRFNWHGSSKAMEGDVAVELVKDCESEKCRITTIIGDDDATTISKIEKSVDYPVKKLSDFNHCKKTVANDLYSLQKTFKILQPKVINYFTNTCFTYAISQNLGDPKGTEKSIHNITPHVFGEHDECGPWCKKKNDPSRTYASLPNGKRLEGVELRVALNRVFSKHAKNSERLCLKSSSQANESFNRTLAAKAPKSHHFSKSESLNYRIASAVCQKNLGESYVNFVNKEISLSPGKVIGKGSDRRDNAMLKKKEKASTIPAKKRRRELKSLRYSTTAQREVREGVTYQSSICLNSTNDIELISIPAPSPLPEIQQISSSTLSSSAVCVFDLETTSLSDICDLVQISAQTLDRECAFNCYILPVAPISPAASRVTGLTKQGNNLFCHSKLVPSVSLTEGLEMFSNWLSSLNKQIVLVGHNIKSFDIKHFKRHVKYHELDSKFDMIVGYIDTLPLFKSLYPKLTSYSQTSLYAKIIGGKYDAHNAIGDVKALAELLTLPNIDCNILCNFSMKSSWIQQYCTFLSKKKSNTDTFHILLQNKVLSKGMIEKTASSGLTLEHLNVVFTRDGETGLRSLLSEKFEGKVRVTKSAKIHSTLVHFFKSLNEKT